MKALSFLPLAPTAALLIAAALFSGCDQVKTKVAKAVPVDAGANSPGRYSSEFFRFDLSFPNHWQVLDPQTQREVNEAALSAITAQNPQIREEAEASAERTFYLLGLMRDGPGQSANFNPNLVCTAEEVASRGITKPEAFWKEVQGLLNESGLPITFPAEPRYGELGGREFYAAPLAMNMFGMSIRQYFYIAIVDGHALTFTLSYTDSSQFADLQRALKTIRFN